MFEELTNVGLTESEIKIYLMLLDIKRAQVGVLSRKTGLHRRSIYDVLDRLIEKGLVSYIQENGKRYYIAEDPKKIQDIIENKRESINLILPQLIGKYNLKKEKQETLFYRGREGIKSIFEDQIRTKEDVYIIGASRNAKEIMSYYLKHYTKKRIEENVKLYAIYSGERKKAPPFAKVKYLNKEFETIVSTNIYGNKVAIIIWLEHDPVAIVIQQPDVVKTYKNYFNLLWKIAKK